MYRIFRELVLRWLKVPPEPHPPAGAPASVRIFHAGRKFLALRLFTWGIAQLGALAGIIFWFVVLLEVERSALALRANPGAMPVPEPKSQVVAASPPSAKPSGRFSPRASRNLTWPEFKQSLAVILARLPAWCFVLLWIFKFTGFLLYLVQIPFTYAMRRLDYETRWYAVTDRSLRIRTGLVSLQESTMSFANIQQIELKQGPLQRLLGLGDVRVQSAGGGGGDDPHHRTENLLHLGVFQSVDNAAEIRDLILQRLRQFRAAGLGDPDEAAAHPPTPSGDPLASGAAVAAARELLAEARALRGALTR